MSDSEATGADGSEAAAAAPEIQDAVDASDGTSQPTSPDISTDVAPTRKARRRPDTKPAAEVEETPKVEEQPSKALM